VSIRKAVILAAGYGTRFLPATKAMPKEMLPVVDKPMIQYVVEDAVAAGVKDIIIVTSAFKRPIEDHFDNVFELETVLHNGGKKELLQAVREIAGLANFIYIRQKGPYGTLTAIQNAYTTIGNEPFLALWGDDFFVSEPSSCQQIVEAYERYPGPILPVIETHDPKHADQYAFIKGSEVAPNIFRVEAIIEKPGRDALPSPYASVGGLLVTPDMMTVAEGGEPLANGEYHHSIPLARMIKMGMPVYARKITNGTYYDCGKKLDLIKATVTLALQHPEMQEELITFLKEQVEAARHG